METNAGTGHVVWRRLQRALEHALDDSAAAAGLRGTHVTDEVDPQPALPALPAVPVPRGALPHGSPTSGASSAAAGINS